jgi:hypothetical protein
VPALVERLTGLDAAGKLGGLLDAAGYHTDHAESYADLPFSLIDERWFEVTDSFPRLSAGSFPDGRVPAGLSEFRYALDLGAVPLLPLSSARVEELLEAMVK